MGSDVVISALKGILLLTLVGSGDVAIAQAAPPDPGAPPAVPGPTPAPVPPPRPPVFDPWLAAPGSTPPTTTVEGQAAAVAMEEGLGPQAIGLMLQFYRPRSIAVAPSARGGYVFTVGEAQRVVSETAVLDSFVALTGSNELERYRVARPRPIGGILLAGGGVVVAYLGAEVALACSASDTFNSVGSSQSHTCHPGLYAGIALGGLIAAGVGVVMVARSQTGANDPDLHRIPLDQAGAIVQRYNLALLKRAARMVRLGDWQGLRADTSPRPRSPGPARLGLGPAGLVLRF
jgi:hypothetical protein